MGVDISGPGGSLILTGFTGFTAHIAGWVGSMNITTVETSGFTDLGTRTYAPTALMMSGSFDGTGQTGAGANLPSAGSAPTMTSYIGSLTLATQTGHYFAMNAVISGMTFSRRFDGKLDIAGNFLSTGGVFETGS